MKSGVVIAVCGWVASLAAMTGVSGCLRTSQGVGWEVNRSKNVVLYTDAKKEHEFIQEWLELSHAAMQAFFPNVRTGPVDAVWLKNQPGAMTRVFGPMDDPRSGWTFETMPSGGIGREGLIVLERRQEHRGMYFAGVRDESLAKEQMAHLFIMKAVRTAPLWLQVGLGRYLEKYRIHYHKDFWLACFGSPVFDEPVQSSFGGSGDGRRVTLPLHDIFASDWYQYERGRRRWYEYTAYAFVHYLLHGSAAPRQRFEVLLSALSKAQSTEDALATAYPHILIDEWDDRVDAWVRPPRGPAHVASQPYIAQGLCLRIPPAHHAEKTPRKSPADARDIQLLLGDLQAVDPFRRHSGWWPEDILRAEAARRPGRRAPGPPPPAGKGQGASGREGRGASGQTTPQPPQPPDDDTPSVRVPAAPPPD